MAETLMPVYPGNERMRMQGAGAPTNRNAASPAAVQPKVKNDGKIYWILGAAGAFVFLIGIFSAALGLGVYFYTLKSRTMNAGNYPKSPETPIAPDGSKTSSPDSKTDSNAATSETIKDFYASKKKVGKFELAKIFENRANRYFLGADSEAGAIYSSPNKNEDVMIDMATYFSRGRARIEFIETVEAEKKAGAKMISEVKEDATSIGAAFQSKKLYVLTSCRLRDDSFSSCYRMSSFNRIALVNFHESFFTK